MDLIMLVSIYPVLLILYFMLVNEVKPKKNIILGVTLSYDARNHGEVIEICNGFKKSLIIATLILAPIPLVALLIPLTSAKFMIYMTWTVLVILIPYGVYVRNHLKLKKVKMKYGWKSEYALEESTTIDIKVAAMDFPRIHHIWFLPSVIIATIPIVATLLRRENKDEWIVILIMYGTNMLMTLTFVLMHRIIYRQKAEIVDDNSELTSALTRVRRYHWSKSMIIAASLTAAFSLGLYLLDSYPIATLVIAMIYTVLLCYFLIRVEFIVRKVQQKLTADSGHNYYIDDDEYWILGMFYYNIHDKHLMINNRVGVGTTVNMAKLSAKIIMTFSALCILLLPFLGIYLMKEELTPLRMEATSEELVVTHLKEVLRLDYDKITDVEMLEQLPPTRKIVGSNFDHLWKGKFSVGTMGTYRIYLNPKEGPFLILETEEENYIIGSDDNKINEIYEIIANSLSDQD